MTQERGFDRIARAWLEAGPNEAPDRAISAVLAAIETTPQLRRPWRWSSWRPITMTPRTFSLIGVLMLALVIGTAPHDREPRQGRRADGGSQRHACSGIHLRRFS